MSDLHSKGLWFFEGSGVHVGDNLWLLVDLEIEGDAHFAEEHFQVVSIHYDDKNIIEKLVLVNDNGEEVRVSGEEYFYKFSSYEPGKPIPLI